VDTVVQGPQKLGAPGVRPASLIGCDATDSADTPQIAIGNRIRMMAENSQSLQCMRCRTTVRSLAE